MFASEDEKVKDYIPWLFACAPKGGLQDHIARLKMALEQQGWFEHTLQRASAMRPTIHLRHIEKNNEVSEQVAAGQFVHPHIVKMHQLQVAVDADRRDGNVSASTGGTQILPHAVPPKREHRSTSSSQNTHCAYCGEIGHRMKRCPKVVQALHDQETGVTVMTAAAELTGKEKQLAELVAHLKYTWTEQRTQDQRLPSRGNQSVSYSVRFYVDI